MAEKDKGKKFDEGKLDWTLLPWTSLSEVVEVLQTGVSKYGRDNWKDVNPPCRYVKACFRHLISWVSGQADDPETGKSHLAHAVCCLLFLIWFEKNKREGLRE